MRRCPSTIRDQVAVVIAFAIACVVVQLNFLQEYQSLEQTSTTITTITTHPTTTTTRPSGDALGSDILRQQEEREHRPHDQHEQQQPLKTTTPTPPKPPSTPTPHKTFRHITAEEAANALSWTLPPSISGGTNSNLWPFGAANCDSTGGDLQFNRYEKRYEVRM